MFASHFVAPDLDEVNRTRGPAGCACRYAITRMVSTPRSACNLAPPTGFRDV